MTRLWLDDERDPRDRFIQRHYGATGDEVWVRTAAEAIALLEAGGVVSASLDHDLGNNQPTGRVVADWIESAAESGRLQRIEVAVHSDNPVGAAYMRRTFASAERFWRRHERREVSP